MYSQLKDEELAVLSRTDSEAGAELLRRYKKLVSAVSRKYFFNDGNSDDVIQEGEIGVFKAMSTFNGSSPFKNYAYKCIKTSIISAIKKSNANKNKPLSNYISLYSLSVDDDEDKTLLIMDTKVGPEESVINEESESELKKFIASTLSKLEFSILTLYLEGFSYEEIANKTNRQTKSIDNAIQRIRKKLSVKLKEL